MLGCWLLAQIGRICTFLIYISIETQVKQLYNSMPFPSLFQCCRIWVLFSSKRVWEANDCMVIRDPIWLHLDSLEDVISSRARIKMYISNCTSSKTWLGCYSVLGFNLRLSAYCNLSICRVCVSSCPPTWDTQVWCFYTARWVFKFSLTKSVGAELGKSESLRTSFLSFISGHVNWESHKLDSTQKQAWRSGSLWQVNSWCIKQPCFWWKSEGCPLSVLLW